MSHKKENINPIMHLNDYQMSLAAEAMVSDEYDNLSEEISQHISACGKCKSDMLTLVEVLEQMNGESKILTPSTSDQKVRKPNGKRLWPVWLAAASIAALLLSTFFYQKNSLNYQSEITSLKDSIDVMTNNTVLLEDSSGIEKNAPPIIEDRFQAFEDSLDKLSDELNTTSELLAEGYKRNSSFDQQIRMNLRSTAIEVLSDKRIQSTYGKTLELKWESDGTAKQSIALYNNKGLMIIKESDLKNNYFLNSKQLTPGLYYWKLIGEESVVFLGEIELK